MGTGRTTGGGASVAVAVEVECATPDARVRVFDRHAAGLGERAMIPGRTTNERMRKAIIVVVVVVVVVARTLLLEWVCRTASSWSEGRAKAKR